jgi:predicted small metal-binding protein
MAKEISCDELGIVGCDFIARGETAGDVVEQVVQHLHSEHDIDLPDADAILEGRVGDNPNVVGSKEEFLIIERLRESLDIEPMEGTIPPKPAAGQLPSR